VGKPGNVDSKQQALSDLAYKKILKSSTITPHEVVDMLINAALDQKHYQEGFDAFNMALIQSGAEVEFEKEDQAEMSKLIDRLFKLRMYRRLVAMTGLHAFEDQIMGHIIDKYFKPGEVKK
jgi:hypothetical protein